MVSHFEEFKVSVSTLNFAEFKTALCLFLMLDLRGEIFLLFKLVSELLFAI